MKKIIVFLLLSLCLINVRAQSIDQIRNKANSGDAYSQYLMGWSYANGTNGVLKNYNNALPWFKKASKNGFGAASYFIGWMYYYGEGVEKDETQALEWFNKASTQGMNESSSMVASIMRKGPIVPKDIKIDKFDPKNPPILEILANSVKFVDPNGNNAIDAGEECYIKFKVKNKGTGAASNCVANILSADAVNGLEFNSKEISYLPAETTREITIPVNSNLSLKDGTVDLVLQVNEPHGLGSDPIQLAVATKRFVAPKLEIVDYAITSASGETLKKKVPFDMQLLLQNVQHGNAEDVTVDFSAPKGVIVMDDAGTHRSFSNLSGGASKSVVYQLIVSNDFKGNTIPLDIKVREKYGKYAMDKHIDLQLNQNMAANKIIVEEKQSNEKSFDIQVASLTSDVDKNIPVVDKKADNVFAVIIGNESYNKEAGVPFAANDGKVFAEYCKNVLGLPKENIHLVVNATLNDMKHEIGWLSKVLETRKGNAKAIFYYAGHGIPDEASKNAYLLPVDGYGSETSTGYPLENLYMELGNTPSQSVTIFLDACFSGAKREGDMLASARGVALKANRGVPVGNTIVFSAAQGDETAYPYKKEGHGLFTYYLLKELKSTKGDVTLRQLGNYITEEVSQQSIVINSKPQTPTIIPAKTISNDWGNWKLK